MTRNPKEIIDEIESQVRLKFKENHNIFKSLEELRDSLSLQEKDYKELKHRMDGLEF